MSEKSYISNTYEIYRSAVPRDVSEAVYYKYFSRTNVDYISRECTLRLHGVHPEGKNIIIDPIQIVSVMDSIYTSTYRDCDKMTMMAISYLVEYISDEFATVSKNQKLSAWVQNFGPETGLQQYSKIKLRDRGPTRMIFNMNY